MDVEGFGNRSRSNADRVLLRDGLYKALMRAFHEAGISWVDCRYDDCGDRVFVLAPAEMPKGPFVESLPVALAEALREHNGAHRAQAGIRLRMALHAGEINYDQYGVTSAAINLTFRLLDAPPLRTALSGTPGLLALITSSWFYDEVVRHSTVCDPTTFRPVRVKVKETNTVGWISLPDHPYPPKQPQLPPPAASTRLADLEQAPPLNDHVWAPPGLARFQLPPDVTDFVGRQPETRFVKHGLVPGRIGTASGLHLVAVYGPPGVGKTSLAVHAAHELCTAFPDGQLYADLRGAAPHRREPHNVIAAFLRALGIAGDALPDELEDRVALYRSLLHDRRVLVFLDNASDEQQIRPLLPGSPTTAVLVTSRTPMSGLDGVTLLRLNPLPTVAAVQLLKLIAGHKARADQDLTQRIVRYCGELPLAVRIAGARLAGEPNLSLASLGDRLVSESRRLDELEVADRAVRASFELSYQVLPDPQRNLFNLLGLLGPVSFAPWLAAALADADARDMDAWLAGLVHAQLLIPLASDRYRLHDLIRLFATESMARADREYRAGALDRAGVSCIALVQRINEVVFPSAPLTSSDMPTRQGAVTMFDVEKDAILSVVEALCDANQAQLAWRTAAELPALLQMLGDWDDWSRMTNMVLTVTAAAGESYGHARLLIEWGNLCRERGAWDAATDAYQQARDLLHQVGDVHWEADAVASLGALRRDQDRLEESATALREAIALFRTAGSRRGEALALSNLGTTVLRQGDDTLAEKYFQQCRTVFRELGDRRWEAYSLSDLAHVLHRRQQWESAIEHCENALSILREYKDELGVGRCLGNLGDIRLDQGQLDDALAHYLECAQIMEQLGSPYETARAMRRLSEVFNRKDDPEHAAEYERRGRDLDSRAWSIAW